ncbi:MAG: hypothetical protein JW902_15075 [Syntrophaceae bacterium]|nr:hypothetical protein [Syntrophaceae bacterium]
MTETMHTDSGATPPDYYRTIAQYIMMYADRNDGIWLRFEKGEMYDI